MLTTENTEDTEAATPETDVAIKDSKGQWSFALKEACQRLERERDEAQKILSGIFHWIERRHPDGFIDSLTHEQNLDRVYDRLCDRIDNAEGKLLKVLKLLDAYEEATK